MICINDIKIQKGGARSAEQKDLYSSEVVKLTQELIRIPSHVDVKDRESNDAEFIYNYCKGKGFEVEFQEVEGLSRRILQVIINVKINILNFIQRYRF